MRFQSLIAIVLLLPTLHVGASNLDSELSPLRQEFTWRGDDSHVDRTAFILRAIPRSRQTFSIQRALLHDGHHRLVGLRLIDLQAGRELFRLLDDETGWWVELDVGFGVRSQPGEQSPQYFQRLEEWLNNPDNQVEFRVRTSTGFEATRRLAAGPHLDDLGAELAESLAPDVAWREAEDAIPATVGVATRGWHGLLREISKFNMIFEFLAEATGLEPDPVQRSLVVSKTRLRGGDTPETSQWQELHRTFEHFDPDNPFPEDLFDTAGPP